MPNALRAGARYTSWFFFALALIGVPLLYSAGSISIETVNQWGRFISFAVVALGIDLVWGYTGMLSLCQAMFFCLGGYCMGMYLAMHGPLDGDGIPRCLFVVSSAVGGLNLPSFWKPFDSFAAAIILGLAVPGIAAFVFGYFAFRSRVRGVYFSIITQATTLGAWLMFCRNDLMLCGTNGLTNFTRIAGYELREPNTKLGLYIASVAVLGISYVLCRMLVNSRLGRILIAIRDNESRLRFSGYQPNYYKVFVFSIAAMLAGLGGMLYVPQMGIITPSNMGVAESIMMVVCVAFGGRGTLSGAVLGALIVNLMYNVLTTQAPQYWPFVQGALFIGVVLYFPAGLIGFWHRLIAPPQDPVKHDESPVAPAPKPTKASPIVGGTAEEAKA
jgi:urea transport system permease protein